jgi:hypothetical protein
VLFFYVWSGMVCTKYIIVFSLENSFPIELSGEVLSLMINNKMLRFKNNYIKLKLVDIESGTRKNEMSFEIKDTINLLSTHEGTILL